VIADCGLRNVQSEIRNLKSAILKGGALLFEVREKAERALLVGRKLPFRWSEEPEESLDELALLADTAGAEVVDRVVQRRKRIDPAFFLGRGGAERLASEVKAREIDVVLFDEDLSPAQMRNLEQIIGTKIVDRSGLILDIFARRARTQAAKIQVELAQLEYLLPRLTRQSVRWYRGVKT